MKFVNEPTGIKMEFIENEVQVLILENPESMQFIVQELWWQTNGTTGTWILSDYEKDLNIEKTVELIMNPFMLDVNSKRILTALMQEMKVESNDSCYSEYLEANSTILKYLETILDRMPYPLTYNEDIDVLSIYKLYGVRLDIENSCLLDQILSYLKLSQQICGIRLYIFVNLKNYLSEEQIRQLYKEAAYIKAQLLLIEAYYTCKLEGENVMIIDKDKCLIQIS